MGLESAVPTKSSILLKLHPNPLQVGVLQVGASSIGPPLSSLTSNLPIATSASLPFARSILPFAHNNLPVSTAHVAVGTSNVQGVHSVPGTHAL